MTDAPLTNNPPASAVHAATIAELEIELSAWLTGSDITQQAQADELGALLGKMDAARKAAEAALKAERKPHQDAVKALGDEYKPALDKAARCLDVGKAALGKWRRHLEAEAAKRAAELRAEQQRLEDQARAALQASGTDLEARAEAEELAEQAKTHRIAAAVVAKQPAGTAKLGGRSLRFIKRYEARVGDDLDAAIAWAWERDFARIWASLRPIIEAMAVDAAKSVDAGEGQHVVAGGAIVVTVTEDAV
jgi:hypothetical protein